jgi:hypothetical protein
MDRPVPVPSADLSASRAVVVERYACPAQLKIEVSSSGFLRLVIVFKEVQFNSELPTADQLLPLQEEDRIHIEEDRMATMARFAARRAVFHAAAKVTESVAAQIATTAAADNAMIKQRVEQKTVSGVSTKERLLAKFRSATTVVTAAAAAAEAAAMEIAAQLPRHATPSPPPDRDGAQRVPLQQQQQFWEVPSAALPSPPDLPPLPSLPSDLEYGNSSPNRRRYSPEHFYLDDSHITHEEAPPSNAAVRTTQHLSAFTLNRQLPWALYKTVTARRAAAFLAAQSGGQIHDSASLSSRLAASSARGGRSELHGGLRGPVSQISSARETRSAAPSLRHGSHEHSRHSDRPSTVFVAPMLPPDVLTPMIPSGPLHPRRRPNGGGRAARPSTRAKHIWQSPLNEGAKAARPMREISPRLAKVIAARTTYGHGHAHGRLQTQHVPRGRAVLGVRPALIASNILPRMGNL